MQIGVNGDDSLISVDADGGADNFIQIATVLNTTLSNAETLETYGYLIAA